MILIDGYVFDAAISQDATLDSEATSNPVEEGIDATDNVRLLPDVLNVEVVVSNTPTTAVQTARSAFSLTGETTALPSEEARAKLVAIRKAKQRVVIVDAEGRRWEEMQLTKLGLPRTSREFGGMRFRASFQQIEIIKNERSTVKTAVPRGQKKKRRGTKPAPVVFKAPAVLNGRIADAWLGDFIGLIGG